MDWISGAIKSGMKTTTRFTNRCCSHLASRRRAGYSRGSANLRTGEVPVEVLRLDIESERICDERVDRSSHSLHLLRCQISRCRQGRGWQGRTWGRDASKQGGGIWGAPGKG